MHDHRTHSRASVRGPLGSAVIAGLLLSVSACAFLSPSGPPIAPVGRADLVVHTTPHRVGLVDSGWRALALRVHLIRTAQDSIDLQTFIWTEDDAGKLLGYELVRAARRGTRVRVISDGLHTRLSRGFAAFLAAADPRLELRQYNPTANSMSASWVELAGDTIVNFGGINQRAHDKLMVVDGERALIGGRNLENTYFDYATGMNFKDREILVEGDVAADVTGSFERFWEYELTVPTVLLRDVRAAIESGDHPRSPTPTELGIEVILAELNALLEDTESPDELLTSELSAVRGVAFCCDRPGKPARTDTEGETPPENQVTRALMGLIRSSATSVLLQTPYLILSKDAIEMVEDLRAEHPELQLRASSNSLASTDMFPAHAAAYRQKHVLIEHLGIQTHEFKSLPADLTSYIETYDALLARTQQEPTLCLHSKSVVIDGEIAGVGSHNIGPRSAGLNTEVMLFVWDRSFAAMLERSIERDIAPRNSWVVWSRQRVPVLGELLTLIEHVSGAVGQLTTIDLWPSLYASSFELVEGAQPVPPGHPDFYGNYREVGLFPGVSAADQKLWLTHILKATGAATDPLL